MGEYLTVAREATAEQTIEKSRFIAYVRHVESRAEAEDFIAEIRAMHRDARHNVPAFVVGRQADVQWASDDGEPSGTSGMPVLKLLTGGGLTDVVIVITRYFGGIKLGTGGLMRAYTGVAREALEKAGRSRLVDQRLLTLRLPYPQYDRVTRMAGEGGFEIVDAYYDDKVTVSLCVDEERAEQVMQMLVDLTAGQVSLSDITVKKTARLIEIKC